MLMSLKTQANLRTHLCEVPIYSCTVWFLFRHEYRLSLLTDESWTIKVTPDESSVDNLNGNAGRVLLR